jgi:hypothetical protein
MTEAETIALFIEAHGLALATLSIFITLVTAYVVAAYFVGRELTKFQVRFLSLLFIVFAGFTIWGTLAYFYIGDSLSPESGPIWLTPFGVKPSRVVVPIQVLIVLGCLYFMRSMRKG